MKTIRINEEYAELFRKKLGNNLKKYIKNNFNTQKKFADTFNINRTTLSSWIIGHSQPDLIMLNHICETLGISIDYLISGEPSNLTSTSIDYAIFDEVVELTNIFAKEYNIVIGGRQYLAIYENVVNLKRLNDELKTKDIFESLLPTIKTLWIPTNK